jgi:RHS repeat-associated protein
MKSSTVRLLHFVLLIAGLLALSSAQGQVNFRGAGAQVVSTGSSLVPGLPSGTQAGDLAILVVAGRPSDTSTPAAPSGWTLKSSALREIGARDLKIVTYYRVLSGSDTNPTLSVPSGWQGGQAGISGQIAVWSGVSATSPFDVADATGTAAAATPWTPPSTTTVTASARVVSAVASADDNALNLSAAQGFTLRMSGAAYDTTTGGDHSVGVGDKDQPTAGAVTMPSWGQTVNASDAWVGISFVLKPKSVELYFIHTDHLDTPRLITNMTQQAVWRWDNDEPFGNNMPNENPSGLGNFTCNLRLPGQYFDKETNLHYNYFRDYDPAIGRYVQSDPIGLQGGINTYAYVGSNPLAYSDPTGETPWILIGAAAGGLFDAIKKARDPCASWSQIGLAFVGGAISGGAAAAAPIAALGRGLGILGAAGYGTAFGAAGSAVGQAFGNSGVVDPTAVAISAATGGIGGGLGNVVGLSSSLSSLRSGATPTAAGAIAQGRSVGTGVSYYYGFGVGGVGATPPPSANSCACTPR